MRILLLEDEAQLRAALALGLREEGYVVDECSLVEDAIYRATITEFDLMIFDVMLPDGDGFTACRRVREAGMRAPVLFLTARDEVSDRIAGLDAGADDYLGKPFDFGELLARLRALTRRVGGNSELRLADLTLDPAKARVERAGVLVSLSAKEYALLEFLLRHPEEVLSRARIAEAIWQDENALEGNLVDVFISYLRAKIDKPFAKPLIHTVRGMGYVLREEQ